MFVRKIAFAAMALAFLAAGCDVDRLLGKAKEKAKSFPSAVSGKKETTPAVAVPAGDFPDQFTIYYGPAQNPLRVKKEGEGKWSAVDGGKTFVVTVDPEYEVTLTEGDRTVAAGRLSEGGLKLATPAKTFYLKIKFKEEKIKVFLSEDAEVSWDLKTKADEETGELKVKVKYGEEDRGKVKFDAAKGKLKVKDKAEQEVAVSKEIGRLSAAPGVFLISDLSPDQRNFLFLLLIALNK